MSYNITKYTPKHIHNLPISKNKTFKKYTNNIQKSNNYYNLNTLNNIIIIEFKKLHSNDNEKIENIFKECCENANLILEYETYDYTFNISYYFIYQNDDCIINNDIIYKDLGIIIHQNNSNIHLYNMKNYIVSYHCKITHEYKISIKTITCTYKKPKYELEKMNNQKLEGLITKINDIYK